MKHTTERVEGLKSNTKTSLYLLATKWTTVDGTRRNLEQVPWVSEGEELGEFLKATTASSSTLTPTTVSSWVVSSCTKIKRERLILVVAYFCTFHTSHFYYQLCHYNYCVWTCMLLSLCQHAMLISEHATYIVDMMMQEKCVIITGLTKHVSGENSKTEFKLRKNHEALMFLDIL